MYDPKAGMLNEYIENKRKIRELTDENKRIETPARQMLELKSGKYETETYKVSFQVRKTINYLMQITLQERKDMKSKLKKQKRK